MRTVELQGVTNVRDLGEIPVAGGRMVKPGLFFRGSALAKATAEDLRQLFGGNGLGDELGVRCVVDLRVGWEREAKPNADLPAGVESLYIPFFDKAVVGIDYVKPLPGTRMIGHDFACDPDDFYQTMANPLTVGQMKKVLEAVFSRALKGQPVYYHCSGGKDRAGITSLLILHVLGASEQDILEDYLLTNAERDKNIEGTYKRFLELCDGDVELAKQVTDNHRARPENLDAFYRGVSENYGAMEDFIRKQLGISDELRDQLRAACTC